MVKFPFIKATLMVENLYRCTKYIWENGGTYKNIGPMQKAVALTKNCMFLPSINIKLIYSVSSTYLSITLSILLLILKMIRFLFN